MTPLVASSLVSARPQIGKFGNCGESKGGNLCPEEFLPYLHGVSMILETDWVDDTFWVDDPMFYESWRLYMQGRGNQQAMGSRPLI